MKTKEASDGHTRGAPGAPEFFLCLAPNYVFLPENVIKRASVVGLAPAVMQKPTLGNIHCSAVLQCFVLLSVADVRKHISDHGYCTFGTAFAPTSMLGTEQASATPRELTSKSAHTVNCNTAP